MTTAKEYIQIFEFENERARNFLNLYQNVADMICPNEVSITRKGTDGGDKTIDLVDTTAVFDAMDMASGLSSTLIPPGQPFFGVRSTDRQANEEEDAKEWFAKAAQTTHDAIFSSNFPMQFNETLKSWVIFGDANIYSERGKGTELNFRDYPAGTFHYLEDSRRIVDTFIEKFEFTARQAVQEWGETKVGPSVSKAYSDEKTTNDLFEFVHVCRPRMKRDPSMIDQLNMAWEDVYVSVKDQQIVREGGFEEFPYHIGRWSKSAKESRGRGVGVFVLPQVRGLNSIHYDLIECANRHNMPPYEVGPGFEGKVDVTPGAVNNVSVAGSIKPLVGMLGNFPITREMLESERQEIHRAFMIDVFNQLINLSGDRRTTLEISERLNEGLRRLSQPVSRLISEVMSPCITRCLLILIRSGVIEEPPESVAGKNISIEYMSPLVLALKRHQSQAFMQWAAFVSEMEAVFPGVKDNIDADRAVRDMGDAFGVKPEHKRNIKDRDKIRKQRAEELAAQQESQANMEAAEMYKQTTRAPEQNSMAKVLTNA